MKVLDLFSGIGGFSLGLERAGMRTVAFCEIDPYCRKVLAKHWPGVPCYDDIKTLTAARLAADGIIANVADADAQNGWHTPTKPAGSGQAIRARPPQSGGRHIDVIAGGFPCQDISSAGRGAGIDGERSGLWREMARVIGEVRPRYVIVENVSALLVRGLERVLGDLAALGYVGEWHCLAASHVGAPHRRDRVWIVAYPQGDGRQQWRPEPVEPREAGWLGGRSDVADAPPQRSHGGRRNDRLDGGGNAGSGEERLQEPAGRGRGDDDVADTIGAGLEGRPRLARYLAAELAAIERGRAGAGLADAQSDGLDGMGEAEAPRLRLQIGGCGGQPGTDFWKSEPAVGQLVDGLSGGLVRFAGRVATGVPDRVNKLRALGNAVVPQIPEIIGRAIIQNEGRK